MSRLEDIHNALREEQERSERRRQREMEERARLTQESREQRERCEAILKRFLREINNRLPEGIEAESTGWNNIAKDCDISVKDLGRSVVLTISPDIEQSYRRRDTGKVRVKLHGYHRRIQTKVWRPKIWTEDLIAERASAFVQEVNQSIEDREQRQTASELKSKNTKVLDKWLEAAGQSPTKYGDQFGFAKGYRPGQWKAIVGQKSVTLELEFRFDPNNEEDREAFVKTLTDFVNSEDPEAGIDLDAHGKPINRLSR